MHFFILLEEDPVSKVNLSQKHKNITKKLQVLLEFQLNSLQFAGKNNNNEKSWTLKIKTRMQNVSI